MRAGRPHLFRPMVASMSAQTVSVIIPAHNAARTLRACIESIRAAPHEPPVEIVVVDDASTDDSAALAASLDCTVVRRRSNGGPALSRNAGAKAATGDVLLFVDADTEMLPNTIREAVDALERPGVGAVVGMYEAEPINAGFFPRYYAYLKYYAYTCSTTTKLLAFGAHCAAISKRLFEQVGGYRSIAWGVDVENEELGRRINAVQPVVLARQVRVRHNFPGFRKLLTIFTRRVYWWMMFRRCHRVDETILMTARMGVTTAAAPLATCFALGAAVLPNGSPFDRLPLGAMLIAAATFLVGYAGFFRLCMRRRSVVFALMSIVAAFCFSHVIVASAAAGHAVAIWRSLRRRPFPFVEAALGQT